ncbi:adenylate cyclase [Necator americanus]|uniref:Adenylate cyclase n=1 Tax=Necator americanus TaxID=51031 RepID=W2TVH5_NECAM|nr:adenylate cyclase [Necator americanus]ETN85071.1 adenylate cyclase [Necator americanus]
MLQLQYFNDEYDSDRNMRQSIVLKARVNDIEQAENAIFELTESLGTFFIQEDVYFNVPNGNLKLRIMHPNATLNAALGERGTITKKRRAFTMNDARIYLDDVDHVGQFIDIAVTLTSSEPDACIARAKEIRDHLKIDEDAIVPAAYLDMMMENLSFDDDPPSRKSTKSGSETESDDSVLNSREC